MDLALDGKAAVNGKVDKQVLRRRLA